MALIVPLEPDWAGGAGRRLAAGVATRPRTGAAGSAAAADGVADGGPAADGSSAAFRTDGSLSPDAAVRATNSSAADGLGGPATVPAAPRRTSHRRPPGSRQVTTTATAGTASRLRSSMLLVLFGGLALVDELASQPGRQRPPVVAGSPWRGVLRDRGRRPPAGRRKPEA